MATATEVSPTKEVKPPAPEVQVDTKLESLLKATDVTWKDVIKYCQAMTQPEKDRDAIISKTLRARMSDGSANVELSRIRGYLKPENKEHVDAFFADKITLSELRKRTTSRRNVARNGGTGGQSDSRKSDADKYSDACKNAATFALNVVKVQKDKFLQDIQTAWDEAVRVKTEADASQARTAAGQQGSFSAEPANKKQTKAA